MLEMKWFCNSFTNKRKERFMNKKERNLTWLVWGMKDINTKQVIYFIRWYAYNKIVPFYKRSKMKFLGKKYMKKILNLTI
jgi:hypothetical protein